MLYFAYGSNLNHFQMKRRCKDSFFIKKIDLKGFRLNFRSKYRAADIEKKRNLLMKVTGAIEYLTEIGVTLPKEEETTPEAPSEPEVVE